MVNPENFLRRRWTLPRVCSVEANHIIVIGSTGGIEQGNISRVSGFGLEDDRFIGGDSGNGQQDGVNGIGGGVAAEVYPNGIGDTLEEQVGYRGIEGGVAWAGAADGFNTGEWGGGPGGRGKLTGPDVGGAGAAGISIDVLGDTGLGCGQVVYPGRGGMQIGG